MIDSQSVAIRKAMSLDAEWHRADAQFNAACITEDESTETVRKRRARWQKDFDAQPERQKRRAAYARAARATARQSS